MLMAEWTSEQFSFYNNRIEDLQDDYNVAPTEAEKSVVLDNLVGVVDGFIGIGKDDITELGGADDRRIRGLSKRVGLRINPQAGVSSHKNKLLSRYKRNIDTLEQMKAAIISGDWSNLRQYAGSMGQMAFPNRIPTRDAPFKVLMGFLSNMQLVGHNQGVIRNKRAWEDIESDQCPVCESELCRCCPDCKQIECVCEQNAVDRIEMLSDFIPEDL